MSMSLKGPAFHEYLSFTSQIAKLECSRLSESKDIKLQRRSRTSKHYLTLGGLSLSPEDVGLLARSTCFNDSQLHAQHDKVANEKIS
ncbi:hypothetical protein ACMD2_22940 [Ananas comosus]|nr:hypothetical protein ACMD2_22940 [Ananas comosus]